MCACLSHACFCVPLVTVAETGFTTAAYMHIQHFMGKTVRADGEKYVTTNAWFSISVSGVLFVNVHEALLFSNCISPVNQIFGTLTQNFTSSQKRSWYSHKGSQTLKHYSRILRIQGSYVL